MTIKTTNDGRAAVNTELFWIPIAEVEPPRGAKLLLINRRQGVATMGEYRVSDNFTHWQALPKFKEGQ